MADDDWSDVVQLAEPDPTGKIKSIGPDDTLDEVAFEDDEEVSEAELADGSAAESDADAEGTETVVDAFAEESAALGCASGAEALTASLFEVEFDDKLTWHDLFLRLNFFIGLVSSLSLIPAIASR